MKGPQCLFIRGNKVLNKTTRVCFEGLVGSGYLLLRSAVPGLFRLVTAAVHSKKKFKGAKLGTNIAHRLLSFYSQDQPR